MFLLTAICLLFWINIYWQPLSNILNPWVISTDMGICDSCVTQLSQKKQFQLLKRVKEVFFKAHVPFTRSPHIIFFDSIKKSYLRFFAKRIALALSHLPHGTFPRPHCMQEILTTFLQISCIKHFLINILTLLRFKLTKSSVKINQI